MGVTKLMLYLDTSFLKGDGVVKVRAGPLIGPAGLLTPRGCMALSGRLLHLLDRDTILRDKPTGLGHERPGHDQSQSPCIRSLQQRTSSLLAYGRCGVVSVGSTP
jgi:hypothetical protein